MFTLSIKTGNAAFHDDADHPDAGEPCAATAAEVARILRRAADDVEGGATSGRLLDVNGNTVGSFNLAAVE